MKREGTSCSETRRPRESLQVVERQAVAVRKMLTNCGRIRSRRFRGVIDDAVKLAETIEHLARKGQNSSAEEAVEIEFRVETLVSLLEVEVDQLYTS
jgi:hypothetical protein